MVDPIVSAAPRQSANAGQWRPDLQLTGRDRQPHLVAQLAVDGISRPGHDGEIKSHGLALDG